MDTLNDAPGQLGTTELREYVQVKLSLLGLADAANSPARCLLGVLSPFIAQYREKERLLASHLCPVDQRIQTFLFDYLQELPVPRLPTRTFVLDRPGMARLLSLPAEGDEFTSEILQSYRVRQGVLHNPRSDRRTTQGIFHITEGGLPVPADKVAVPKAVFANLLAQALKPPTDALRLPYTTAEKECAHCFVSLLIRPVICPEIPGFTPEKSMEIRFIAPGSLVSNLDFVESIFGNAGDPGLPENDAGLDAEHWSGHTGCVILAPHLTRQSKLALGLPRWEEATERQRQDGMCWRDPQEFYNGGQAFKITCRDENGVMVTVVADNYYGYCKKEVKTQISFAANLFGLCEEEHAGGAVVFPRYDLGEDFSGERHVKPMEHTLREAAALFSDQMDLQPEGYGIDRRFPDIIYVPEDARFDLHQQRITWATKETPRSIKFLPGKTYMRPSGYKVHLEKPGLNRAWRLVGTVAEGILCHKPSTVSGGGKSEISKPITDAILTGPVFVADFEKDFDQVTDLVGRDYSQRFRNPGKVDHRPILSMDRSLGSVIKLLTPAERDYKPEYNAWLETIPQHIKELVFVLKRYYKPAWGDKWRDHFSVDTINGKPANELKCHNRKLVTTYLRVGFDSNGAWRTFGLRKDFNPAAKIQVEDDITASVVVPPGAVGNPDPEAYSLKFVHNTELRLFQRPDDAIHPGYDKQTESDFVRPDNFFSNYEPLRPDQAREIVDNAVAFAEFTEPMQNLIRSMAGEGSTGIFVSSAHPRLVEGKPTKNPRYLQLRPDLVNPRETYVAEMGRRLRRRLPKTEPLLQPVGAVLPGRRNNPPDGQVRSLAVFNPIHYLELPELFMEFICSMTGKSPSTTGAGSEGALTKGPFNALPPIIDLNNALVSWLLAGHHGFVTAAGFIGPRFRVDHDISLIMPELWCRMTAEERDPAYLISRQYLEPCCDFDVDRRRVLASRLGYRINARFVQAFFGRIFNHPHSVLTEEMLRPELQDMAAFTDGMDNIVSTQKRVAQLYFDDGSIAQACPPLQALLHLMRADVWNGKDLGHPDVRALFTRESLLTSDWYQERLVAKQKLDQHLWKRHAGYLERFSKKTSYAEEAERLGISARLEAARSNLRRIEAPDYIAGLRGSIGAEPIEHYARSGG